MKRCGGGAAWRRRPMRGDNPAADVTAAITSAITNTQTTRHKSYSSLQLRLVTRYLKY